MQHNRQPLIRHILGPDRLALGLGVGRPVGVPLLVDERQVGHRLAAGRDEVGAVGGRDARVGDDVGGGAEAVVGVGGGASGLDGGLHVGDLSGVGGGGGFVEEDAGDGDGVFGGGFPTVGGS